MCILISIMQGFIIKKKDKVDNTKSIKERTCIEKVISLDDSFGSVRNHACETVSLSEAIEQYVDNMNKLDFRSCPKTFTIAFKEHQKAWKDILTVTDNYTELRGEMHELFKIIENGRHANSFNPLLKFIWDTWTEVENSMK